MGSLRVVNGSPMVEEERFRILCAEGENSLILRLLSTITNGWYHV
jgi:hypothetical protein